MSPLLSKIYMWNPKNFRKSKPEKHKGWCLLWQKKKCFWSEKYFSTISVELCFMFISSKSKEWAEGDEMITSLSQAVICFLLVWYIFDIWPLTLSSQQRLAKKSTDAVLKSCSDAFQCGIYNNKSCIVSCLYIHIYVYIYTGMYICMYRCVYICVYTQRILFFIILSRFHSNHVLKVFLCHHENKNSFMTLHDSDN